MSEQNIEITDKYCDHNENYLRRDGLVAVQTKLKAGQPRNYGSIPAGNTSFLFTEASGPVLRTSQPTTQWVLEKLTRAYSDRNRMLNIYLYLVPRLSIAVLPHLHISSWRALEDVTFYI